MFRGRSLSAKSVLVVAVLGLSGFGFFRAEDASAADSWSCFAYSGSQCYDYKSSPKYQPWYRVQATLNYARNQLCAKAIDPYNHIKNNSFCGSNTTFVQACFRNNDPSWAYVYWVDGIAGQRNVYGYANKINCYN